MKSTASIELMYENRRELFPDSFASFPYIASRAELDRYLGDCVPWHWHNAVELFYMESGELEYNTPGGKLSFSAGSGGLVNSGVLHMTRPLSKTEENVQLLHIFDPSLIAGAQDGLIAQKYTLPIVTDPGLQIIPIYPDSGEKSQLLELLRQSFELDEGERGYELRLRARLSELWLRVTELAPQRNQTGGSVGNTEQLQIMLAYIYENYPEKIAVSDLAQAAFTSERECYRLFANCLHCSPKQYILSYRLQMAADRLVRDGGSVTEISQAYGFNSSSYFGQQFMGHFHCTPSEYRRRWRKSDKTR